MKEENQKLINKMHNILKINKHEMKMHEMLIWDLKAEELSKTTESSDIVKKTREAVIPVVKYMKDNIN